MAFGFLKKAIKGVGKFVGKAASLPIRGVGRIARGNFREGFGDILGGAARTAAIIGTGGLAGLGPGLGGAVSAIGSGVGAAGGAIGGAAGSVGGIGGVGGFLSRNAPTILGGISALSNARDATRTRGLEDEQFDFARESMARRRELEDQIMGGFGQAPPSFDFSSTYADPSNPFYQPQPGVPGVGGDIVMPENVPIPTQGPVPGIDPNTLSLGGGGRPPFDVRMMRRA